MVQKYISWVYICVRISMFQLLHALSTHDKLLRLRLSNKLIDRLNILIFKNEIAITPSHI